MPEMILINKFILHGFVPRIHSGDRSIFVVSVKDARARYCFHPVTELPGMLCVLSDPNQQADEIAPHRKLSLSTLLCTICKRN